MYIMKRFSARNFDIYNIFPLGVFENDCVENGATGRIITLWPLAEWRFCLDEKCPYRVIVMVVLYERFVGDYLFSFEFQSLG